jgi:Mg2+-importing ATPase
MHFTLHPRRLLEYLREAQPVPHAAEMLLSGARAEPEALLHRLQTQPGGLSAEEAAKRLVQQGPNVLPGQRSPGPLTLFWRSVRNPVVVLLAVLSGVSFATGDLRAGGMMLLMMLLGVGLKLFQELRAENAASRLKSLISVHASVRREGRVQEVPVSHLVPGDVVELVAGDLVPADVRLLATRDLFVAQGSLTGESLPVEKFATCGETTTQPLELHNVAFLGSSVASGTATAVVLATGPETFLGGVARSLSLEHPSTAFDEGIARFTWLMVTFAVVLVPLVFLITGWTKGSWGDAFFFAVAVAVGLTPEMLPMIVTVCLSHGALTLSRKQVIVKRISAIQNLGAMDVLCTDKTGTLTQDRVILERYCDVSLRRDPEILRLAYLNSHFQTGLRSVLDQAVLAHTDAHPPGSLDEFQKVDEIPFDFQRRVMSVVVRTPAGADRLICKGAPEAVFARCTHFELKGQVAQLDLPHIDELRQEYERLSSDGFRVLAIATRESEARVWPGGQSTAWSARDEAGLTLRGYVAFLDPPKESAGAALQELRREGIVVKVVTGDNELVARKVCRDVGLPVQGTLLGSELDTLSAEELSRRVVETTLFARVSPLHKQRIIEVLRAQGHVVGFLGDGINDAPALHAADLGISVDSAVDVAKATADMILLEKSLLVLSAGVIEGRKVFANILKYVRMGASSNFGNMLSVVGASALVPFLPMAPIQILANNLLYDVSQTAIPTDDVDPELIEKPRPWDLRQLTRFILAVGPCSSLFDYSTYLVLLYGFGCAAVGTPEERQQSMQLFQTGWFVESLLTQTLIIHIIRTNRVPFLQSHPSWALGVMSVCVAGVGLVLPFTPLGTSLGFIPLPAAWWPFLLVTLMGYALLTQGVKMWLLRRGWI